jgi:cytochrome P450
VAEHLLLILVAANETTVNLIADTLHMLLTDPRFRANLSGGQMTLPDAVEQVLWDRPPLSTIPGRWAVGDAKIGDQSIKKGDMIMLSMSAGNVDPRIRPDLSVPMHGNRSHLAFSSGPHECPGQDIGRSITETCIDALLVRIQDVQLAIPEEELRWQGAWLSRHLAELPVVFSPTQPKPSVAATPVPEAVPEEPRHLPEEEEQPVAVTDEPQGRPLSWFGGLLRWIGVGRRG